MLLSHLGRSNFIDGLVITSRGFLPQNQSETDAYRMQAGSSVNCQ